MKHIETNLSERRFLNRLENLCRIKTRFSRGYEDKDTFVIKQKNNKFMLGKHYASIGRGDGYANDCLYCRYSVNENGRITVIYRFGRMSPFPFILCFTVGIVLWGSLIYDAIALSDIQWAPLCVTAIFWIFGLIGLLFRSKKERKALEDHLFRICQVGTDGDF